MHIAGMPEQMGWFVDAPDETSSGQPVVAVNPVRNDAKRAHCGIS